MPSSTEGKRRALAESQWLSKGAQLFRLPGLYGPGRNIIERLRDGTARRVHLDGHVFSRLHHDDCATALMNSIERPRPGRAYNLCDDKPASAEEVLLYAAELTGIPAPAPTAFDDLPPSTKRFYADNKRVANARAKAELGWRPRYPTYRDGLGAIYRGMQSS
jgi:nucleoside-diphosphate-sugar epimerase